MAGEKFLPGIFSDDDSDWLASLLNSLPGNEEPASLPTPKYAAPEVPVFTPIPESALRALKLQQRNLIMKMKEMTNHTEVPDEITFDSMPVHLRLYSEQKEKLPAAARFAELTAYRFPDANPLANLMKKPMQACLKVGLYMDAETAEQYQRWSEENPVHRFDHQTLYGIDTTDGIVKIVAQPWSLPDERESLFPDLPEARYVPSNLLASDLQVMDTTYNYFHFRIRDAK